jgi:hypothetical protein
MFVARAGRVCSDAHEVTLSGKELPPAIKFFLAGLTYMAGWMPSSAGGMGVLAGGSIAISDLM